MAGPPTPSAPPSVSALTPRLTDRSVVHQPGRWPLPGRAARRDLRDQGLCGTERTRSTTAGPTGGHAGRLSARAAGTDISRASTRGRPDFIGIYARCGGPRTGLPEPSNPTVGTTAKALADMRLCCRDWCRRHPNRDEWRLLAGYRVDEHVAPTGPLPARTGRNGLRGDLTWATADVIPGAHRRPAGDAALLPGRRGRQHRHRGRLGAGGGAVGCLPAPRPHPCGEPPVRCAMTSKSPTTRQATRPDQPIRRGQRAPHLSWRRGVPP